MMNKKITTYLVITFSVGAVLGVGMYLYNDFRSVTKGSQDNKVSGNVGQEDAREKGKENPEAVEDIKDSLKLGSSNGQGTPDLDRPVAVPSHIPQEKGTLASAKIKEIVGALKENPDLFSHWIDLGIYRKMIEDYDGAREAWEYATRIRPNESLSFNNLANLYGYYIHDNKKAEEYYLQAIEKNPKDLYAYAAAFEFYFYALGDEQKARAILEQGIAANPNTSQPLRDLLDTI